MQKIKFLISFLCLLLFFTSANISADENYDYDYDYDYDDNSSSNSSSSGNYKLSLGGGVALVPEFEGSNKYQAKFIPMLNYDNGYIFVLVQNSYTFIPKPRGAGIYLYNNHNIALTTFANYRLGRDESDSTILKGLGDMDGDIEAGLNLTWNPKPFILSASTAYGFGDVKGLLSNLYVGYQQDSGSFSSEFGVSVAFADTKYMENFFGINSKQALRSGYNVYEGKSGLKHTALSASVNYNLHNNVSLNIFGEYKILASNPSDSPIVKKGSKNQFSSGLSLILHPIK